MGRAIRPDLRQAAVCSTKAPVHGTDDLHSHARRAVLDRHRGRRQGSRPAARWRPRNTADHGEGKPVERSSGRDGGLPRFPLSPGRAGRFARSRGDPRTGSRGVGDGVARRRGNRLPAAGVGDRSRTVPRTSTALAVHHAGPGPRGRHTAGPDLLRGATLHTRPHDRRPPDPPGPGRTRRPSSSRGMGTTSNCRRSIPAAPGRPNPRERKPSGRSRTSRHRRRSATAPGSG